MSLEHNKDSTAQETYRAVGTVSGLTEGHQGALLAVSQTLTEGADYCSEKYIGPRPLALPRGHEDFLVSDGRIPT